MIQKLITFLQEVHAEMKKVTWTGRKDLINSSLIVILSAVCLSVFITLTDIIFSKGLNLIIQK